MSRVYIDPEYTRDILGINPGYPKENLPIEGQELGIRDWGLGGVNDQMTH
jgi:hypothetical protein